MITRMDRDFGRMLALIKELNLDEDTIFVFTSDNGPAPQDLGGTDAEFFNSNGPFRSGKTSIYEGGMRDPSGRPLERQNTIRHDFGPSHRLRGLAPDPAGTG